MITGPRSVPDGPEVEAAKVGVGERALLDKLLRAATLEHSEEDGGSWLEWSGGVSDDLTDDEIQMVKVHLSLAEPFQPHLCTGCLENGHEWLIDSLNTLHAFHDSYFTSRVGGPQ